MDVKILVNLNGDISDAIGFTWNEEFLVLQYPGDLLSFAPESKERKDFDTHGQGDSFFLSKYVKQYYISTMMQIPYPQHFKSWFFWSNPNPRQNM